jgi:CBS domain containing-hemolysin-like protein
MQSIEAFIIQQWQSLGDFFAFDPTILAEPGMLVRFIIQGMLFIASAFFSGSETALFSLSRLDLQQLRREHNPMSATLHALLDQPRRLIISILCGNELINIAAVANMTAILLALYGAEKAGIISILVMVPLLLVLGEITPKTIAVSNPVRISTAVVAAPMSLWVKIVAPMRWLIRGMADRVTSWIVGPEKAPENILQLDEFRSIVDKIASDGQLRDTERTLIYHLLDASVTEVVQIMTPRTRLAFIDGDLRLPEIIQRFIKIRHSYVPVYRKHRDNVIGFLHLEDILPLVVDQKDISSLRLEDILRNPIVAPLTKRIDEMFDFFQRNKARAALVLNEFGGVEGIVTLRDVLKFIFGHLSGEVQSQSLYEERDQNTYIVPGDMKLTDFNSLTNFSITDPRMTTIGGVTFRHLDRLPKEGDQVVVDGITITVLETEEQRISMVRVTRGQDLQEVQEVQKLQDVENLANHESIPSSTSTADIAVSENHAQPSEQNEIDTADKQKE